MYNGRILFRHRHGRERRLRAGADVLSGEKMSIKCSRTYVGCLTILVYLVLPAALHAGESGNNIDAGQKIFTYGVDDRIPACQKCHGPDGMGLGAVDIATPRTASQTYTYLLKQLTDFATNRRTDDVMHQMNRIAKGLSEQQRKDVATYLHSWKWPYKGSDLAQLGRDGVKIGDAGRGGRVVNFGIPERGIPACRVCHGYDGHGAGRLYPMLSGQNYLYLTHELKSFRRAARGAKAYGRANDFMAQMRNVAAKLNDQDIYDVAAFLTGVKPPPMPENPQGTGVE